jgi:hypothetical protein
MEAIMLRALALTALTFALVPPLSAQDIPRADGWVVISVDEYRALRLRAYPPEPPPEPPPIDVVLTRVDYDLHVNGDSIEAKPDWRRRLRRRLVVPLPSGFRRAARGASCPSSARTDSKCSCRNAAGR